MRKNKLISIILTVVMTMSMLLSINTKADAVGGGSPQVTINGKTYDATLSNPRTVNGKTTYDVYVKVPDCNTNGNLDFTSTDKESDQIQGETSNYPNSKDISLSYNGQTYNGTLNKKVDVADTSSQTIKTTDSKYISGGYNGTAYKYVSPEPKKFTIEDYLYNEAFVDSSGNLKQGYQNASILAKFNAVDYTNNKLNIGRAIAMSSDGKILNKSIDGEDGADDAFLVSTDGFYAISSSTMRSGSQTPDSIIPCAKDTFVMLDQAAFQPGTFPAIEEWEWRTDRRNVTNHAVKVGNTWFTVSPDTTLSDVKVSTTHDAMIASYYDVAIDVYLSNGSPDDAKEELARLPSTITRTMHAFSRNSMSYYLNDDRNNPFQPASGSPMDKSDFDIEQSKIQQSNPNFSSFLSDTGDALGSVNFQRPSAGAAKILWLDKKSASANDPNAVVDAKPGYYVRILGQYHYGACNITHTLIGNVAINHYVGAIHYAGTVTCHGSTPDPTPTPTTGDYTLKVHYIDEDNHDNEISSTSKGYKSSEVSTDDTLQMMGSKAVGVWYLPTSAPGGYTLDTDKFPDPTRGYHIAWNVGISFVGNGRSTTNAADLKVYCKKDSTHVDPTPNPPAEETGTVIKRYFLDGEEQTKDEEKEDNVSVGTHSYNVDKQYPRHICSNPTVTVDVTADSVTYCDFNFGFQNHPPTVTLQGPSTVVMGDDFSVNASGVDPDGDSLTYDWNTPSDFKGLPSGYTASGYCDSTGDKTFSVTVTDPYGASGSDSKVVKVVPPIPNVVINKSGTEKENRKVTLNAEKYSSSGSKGRYPLDWSKAKWQFFDGSGNELTVDDNSTSSTIVKSLNSVTGSKNMDLIFKKAGKYTAKCTLYNTAGYSNSFSVDLNIVPDLIPTAEYYFPDGNNILRDPKDLSPNGLAQASHRLADSSKSSDDNIGKRMWLACFDSDNDGSYDTITNNEDGTKKAVPEKERWYVFDLDYNGDSDTRYKVQVPDSTPLNGKLVTIGSDGHKYAYINDSLNPHWRYVGSYDDAKKLDINKINCGNLTNVTFKSTSVGNFDFEEVVQESFGQDTITQLITNNDIKQANTFNEK